MISPTPTKTPLSSLVFSIFLLFSISISISISHQIAMADSSESTPSSGVSPASSEAAVYIVYTDHSNSNEDLEASHVRTLASVLGSEEAAKGALIYSYKSAARGFSAKLTPEQVAEISKQPGVLQVVKSQTLHLHSGTGSFA